MTTPRPLPSKIGIGATGRAHLAFADNTLYCNDNRALTGKITSQPSAGAADAIAALLAMKIPPHMVCRRCLPLRQFRDRYATAWAARSEAEPQPTPGQADEQTAQPGNHVRDEAPRVLVVNGGHTAPQDTDSPGTAFEIDTVTLRAEIERLTTRCAELTTEAQQARQAADAAEAMSLAQAASLAALADMAEQARCHSADFLGDAAFYTEGADKRRRDGLRYTMGRHTELTIAHSAAARGYTRPKPTDLYYPDLPALLTGHGWKETPARELAMHDDTRPQPMLREDRNPAWLRVWRRGTNHVAAWFTSPDTLDYLSCNTRGHLAEWREIEQVITAKDAGRKEPLAPPKPGVGDTYWDTTIDQVDAIMQQQGWTSSSHCNEDTATWRFEWTKTSTDRDATGRPRQTRIYGIGHPGKPAVIWYWAGRITALPQLGRIAQR